jgi:hypothetical protein
VNTSYPEAARSCRAPTSSNTGTVDGRAIGQFNTAPPFPSVFCNPLLANIWLSWLG